MENNMEQEMEQDEVINPEQFQVGRAPEEDKDLSQNDAEYTEDETEFADGAGTALNEEFDDPDEDDAETGDIDLDDEIGSSDDEEDAEFENPDDDPA